METYFTYFFKNFFLKNFFSKFAQIFLGICSYLLKKPGNGHSFQAAPQIASPAADQMCTEMNCLENHLYASLGYLDVLIYIYQIKLTRRCLPESLQML